MTNKTLLFFALLSIVLLLCITIIAWRLRKLAAQRADAERRSAVAFEEMNRLTTELRRRSAEQPAVDLTIPPGARLQQRYPGVVRNGGSSSTGRRDGSAADPILLA